MENGAGKVSSPAQEDGRLTVEDLADQVAERSVRHVRCLFTALAAGLRTRLSEGELVDLLRAWDVAAVLDRFDAAASEVSQPATEQARRILAGIVGDGAISLIALQSRRACFTATHPLVMGSIDGQAAELVNRVTREGREAVRQTLLRGDTGGLGARATGRVIREFVGLTPTDARAVGKQVQRLGEQGRSEWAIVGMGRNHARRLLDLRADTLARTETRRAAIAGQVALWTEMAEDGLLDPHGVYLRWTVTEEDRMCEVCVPMDGKRIRLGEMFSSSHKGFPDGRPEDGRRDREPLATPLSHDPSAHSPELFGRSRTWNWAETLDGRLVPRRDVVSVRHPPLHDGCRCAVVLDDDG